MDLLVAVARNLERHALALESLADELDGAKPLPGARSSGPWADADMDRRIRGMRREARLAWRALSRVEDARQRHTPHPTAAEPAATERAAAEVGTTEVAAAEPAAA